MGCDIHVHVEIKNPVTGKWDHYSNPVVGRNYRLFAMLAGVRGEPADGDLPIAAGRGIPSDINWITEKDLKMWQDGSHHGVSWCTGKEAEELEKRYRTQYPGDYLYAPFGYVFSNSLDREDIRVIFWFDN